MPHLGKQIVAELYGCDEAPLRSLSMVRKRMREAANASNSTVIKSAFHKFGNMGVSGVLVIAESHLCIHTWPEHRYAAVDVFTCGDQAEPDRAIKVLAKSFNARRVNSRLILRGLEDELEMAEGLLPDAGV